MSLIVNWSPTPSEEIVQNVKMIIATDTGSVPLARAFGTPQDVIDKPQSVQAAQLQAAVITAVRTYEPRAKIKEVVLADEGDGKLSATAVLEGNP